MHGSAGLFAFFLLPVIFENCNPTQFSTATPSPGSADLSTTTTTEPNTQGTGNLTTGTPVPTPFPTAPTVKATGSFYASDAVGQLYVFDVDTLRLQQVLTTTYNGQVVVFNGLSFDGAGTLYGITVTDRVLTINPQTGACQLVIPNLSAGLTGSVGSMIPILGFSILPNGRYLSGTGDSVISVDPSNLSYTTLVPASAGYNSHLSATMDGGDLRYLPNGRIYWIVANASSRICRTYGGPGNQTLVEIDPVSGVVTEIGCLTDPDILGFGFSHGTLYGFTYEGDFIQINPATAQTKLITNVGASFLSATGNPAFWQ
ncbi:MAG: hypothetical protein C5B49_16645 [Bdellovibrio sp.]|nr:MAG: hypothetical protein C5B49_16645 [Bdellovibrio sp.]